MITGCCCSSHHDVHEVCMSSHSAQHSSDSFNLVLRGIYLPSLLDTSPIRTHAHT